MRNLRIKGWRLWELLRSLVTGDPAEAPRVGRVKRVPPSPAFPWWDSFHSAHPTLGATWNHERLFTCRRPSGSSY